MRAIAEISIIPLGESVSTSEHLATCERILQEAGLEPRIHANGTNVRGDWDTVCSAVRRAHEAIHGAGAPRIVTHLSLETRVDREQSLEERVEELTQKLE